MRFHQGPVPSRLETCLPLADVNMQSAGPRVSTPRGSCRPWWNRPQPLGLSLTSSTPKVQRRRAGRDWRVRTVLSSHTVLGCHSAWAWPQRCSALEWALGAEGGQGVGTGTSQPGKAGGFPLPSPTSESTRMSDLGSQPGRYSCAQERRLPPQQRAPSGVICSWTPLAPQRVQAPATSLPLRLATSQWPLQTSRCRHQQHFPHQKQ